VAHTTRPLPFGDGLPPPGQLQSRTPERERREHSGVSGIQAVDGWMGRVSCRLCACDGWMDG